MSTDRNKYLFFITLTLIILTSCKSDFILSNEASTNSDDDLMNKCTDSFNECRSIGESKYGGSVKLLKKTRFEEPSKAEEFFNVWKGQTQIDFDYETKWIEKYYPLKELQLEYPAILFAISVKNQDSQAPYVIFCDAQGNLFMTSKKALTCG